MSWIKKITPCGGFIWLAILAALVVGVFLAQDEFLRAWDAYYYALKIKQGTISDGNLVFLLERPFMWLGFSAENAHRVWIALLVLLFLGSLGAVLKQVKNQRVAWALFAWAIVSPSLIYIAVSFPKTFLFEQRTVPGALYSLPEN